MNHIDRVVEERLRVVFNRKHVYSKGSGSQGRMFVQKSKASSTMKKNWTIRKTFCCEKQGSL